MLGNSKGIKYIYVFEKYKQLGKIINNSKI